MCVFIRTTYIVVHQQYCCIQNITQVQIDKRKQCCCKTRTEQNN